MAVLTGVLDIANEIEPDRNDDRKKVDGGGQGQFPGPGATMAPVMFPLSAAPTMGRAEPWILRGFELASVPKVAQLDLPDRRVGQQFHHGVPAPRSLASVPVSKCP